MRVPEGLPLVALDHVAIAAPTLLDATLFGLLEGDGTDVVQMPSGVSVARFGPSGMLEVVVPARMGTPTPRFLERRGAGLHHFAFAPPAPLDRLLDRLPSLGLIPIGEVEPSSDGRKSVFLHPSSTGGVLVELVEVRR
jgi:hypothetical protein